MSDSRNAAARSNSSTERGRLPFPTPGTLAPGPCARAARLQGAGDDRARGLRGRWDMRTTVSRSRRRSSICAPISEAGRRAGQRGFRRRVRHRRWKPSATTSSRRRRRDIAGLVDRRFHRRFDRASLRIRPGRRSDQSGAPRDRREPHRRPVDRAERGLHRRTPRLEGKRFVA
mgnify:CR=1 FL=1